MRRTGSEQPRGGKWRIVRSAWLVLAASLFAAAPAALAASPSDRDARMKWWREARFGMFIHWGVYSVPAGTYRGRRVPGIGEWIMNRGRIPVAEYRKFARRFNPTKYDPDAWVRLAKRAGQRYIVITSKHHDGFALFDSKVTDWDVVDATPYGKDLLEPLAEACRRHGIRLGFYYSQAQDWTHPGGAAIGGHWDPAQEGDMDTYLREIAVPQVREILSNYGPLSILWWDTPAGMNRARADLLRPLLDLQPAIITNNRLGGGYEGDLSTPEQHIPATGLPGRDWETCMTMNDTWGYKSYDNHWKSVRTLIRNLVDIASKGGNYLLNVGPTSLGEIPAPCVERLEAIGRWMRANGEAIYATTASPFPRLAWGRCTKKVRPGGATLYLHVFDWPAGGRLVVPGLRSEVASASLLATGQSVKTAKVEEGVELRLPADAPDPVASVVRLEVAGPLRVERILPRQGADGTVSLSALQADLHDAGGGSSPRVESRYGAPNVGYWLDERDWVSWEFKVRTPGRFTVTGDLAATEESRFTLRLGGRALPARCPATGGYDKFRAIPLGELSIEAPGACRLEMRPLAGAWKPVNVRALALAPLVK